MNGVLEQKPVQDRYCTEPTVNGHLTQQCGTNKLKEKMVHYGAKHYGAAAAGVEVKTETSLKDWAALATGQTPVIRL